MCYQSYYDTTEAKCVAPTTAIANAMSYSSATNVSACNAGYYKKDNTCVEMDSTNFADCKYGSYTTTSGYMCTACNNNFTLVASSGTSATTYSC